MSDSNAVITNTPPINNYFTTQTELLLNGYQTDTSKNFAKQNSISIILPDELEIKKND